MSSVRKISSDPNFLSNFLCDEEPNCNRVNCAFAHPSKKWDICMQDEFCRDDSCQSFHVCELIPLEEDQVLIMLSAKAAAEEEPNFERYCLLNPFCRVRKCRLHHPDQPQRSEPQQQDGWAAGSLTSGTDRRSNSLPESKRDGVIDSVSAAKAICKFDPNCRRASCSFEHPSRNADNIEGGFTKAVRKCKFGSQCNRENCKFEHPSICDHDPNCEKMGSGCPYDHPVRRNLNKTAVKATSSTATVANHSSDSRNNIHTNSSSNSSGGKVASHGSNNICRHDPNCTRADCKFEHPSHYMIACRHDPYCNRDDCKFDHPVRRSRICWHDSYCNRDDCTFEHPSRRSEPTVSSTFDRVAGTSASFSRRTSSSTFDRAADNSSSQPNGSSSSDRAPESSRSLPCRLDPHCNRDDCTFEHPSRRPEPAGSSTFVKATVSSAPSSRSSVCRHDPHCNRDDCKFEHPSRQSEPNGNSRSRSNFNRAAGDSTSSSRSNICRHDPRCNRDDCKFEHPSRRSNVRLL